MRWCGAIFLWAMKMQSTNGSEFEPGGFWQDPLGLIRERGADCSRMKYEEYSKMRALNYLSASCTFTTRFYRSSLLVTFDS